MYNAEVARESCCDAWWMGSVHPLISSSKLRSGHDMLLPQKCSSFLANTNIIVIVVANHRHKSHDDAVVDCFHFSIVGETCGLVEVALSFNAMEAPT